MCSTNLWALLARHSSLRTVSQAWNVHLPPHRLEDRLQRPSLVAGYLPFQQGAIDVRLGDGIQVDVINHGLKEHCSLARGQRGRIFGASIPTTLSNHRLPPSSNQLKWPPPGVVHRMPYGVCCTSSRGRASLAVTCSTSESGTQ